MRKFLKSTSFFAMLLGLAVSCSKNPDVTTSATLTAPEGLKVREITSISAQLSWRAVADVDGYKVSIDNGNAIFVTKTSYTATGLTPETSHTWKVQAFKGDQTSEWVDGPGFSTVATPATPAPTDLQVVNTFSTSVQIRWQHPGADKHEVSIDDGAAYTISGLGCTVNGLKVATKYTWKVRSCKDDIWSEWTQGDDFTTGPRTKLVPATSQYWGTHYGYANAVTFMLGFYDEQLNSTMLNGIQVGLDVVVARGDIDMGESKEFVDIPAGTYEFNADTSTMTGYMVAAGTNSFVAKIAGGSPASQAYVSGGSLTIAGDHTNYTMTFDFACEDGTTFAAEYKGPFNIANPYYIPPPKDPFSFGTLTTMLAMDYRNGFTGASGKVDLYAPIGGDPGTTLVNAKFGGTGWVFGTQMYAANNSGQPMPDGTYTLGDTYGAGTALKWNGSAGTRLIKMENGNQVELYGLVSGTIVSTYSGGMYTLVVTAQDRSGTQISGTVQAAALHE